MTRIKLDREESRRLGYGAALRWRASKRIVHADPAASSLILLVGEQQTALYDPLIGPYTQGMADGWYER